MICRWQPHYFSVVIITFTVGNIKALFRIKEIPSQNLSFTSMYFIEVETKQKYLHLFC